MKTLVAMGATIALLAGQNAAEEGENDIENISEQIARVAPAEDEFVAPENTDWNSKGSGEFVFEKTDESSQKPMTAESDAGEISPLTVSLPEGLGLEESETADDGTLVFRGDKGVDAAVQFLEDDAIRLQTVLEDEDAPTDFQYEFDDGIELAEGPHETVELIQHDGGVVQTLGVIDRPWAFDADGAPIETHYEIDDNVLTQHVEITGDTEFPVVADPKVTSTWWNFTIYFNKNETIALGSGAGVCASTAMAFPEAISKLVAASCGAISAAAGGVATSGKCVKVVNLGYVGPSVPQAYSGGYCK